MLVGAVGIYFALEGLSLPNVNTDSRATRYGFLFFMQLISEPLRVGPVKDCLLDVF